MRVYEFVNNNNFLKKIEELIYFDSEWRFPEYNLREYLDLSDDSYYEFIRLSNLITKELNKRSIDPEIYTDEIFSDILRNIKF